MEQAEAVLRAALTAQGVEVRPGLYPASRIPIRTSPEGLWRWEKDGNGRPILIPEIPQEAPA